MNDSAVVILRGRYVDSIALLALNAHLRDHVSRHDHSGIEVFAALATSNGLSALADLGYEAPPSVSGTDLLIGVRPAALQGEVRELAVSFFEPQVFVGDRAVTPADDAAASHSIDQFVRRGGQADVVVVATPGPFAAAVARRSLSLGFDTMIFSDNVSIDDEVALKQFARDRAVLCMGPDCGTAMLDGVPLGFANAVRSGPIAIVGASGTGVQEVMTLVHRLGSGVSQVIGCGGRDLDERVGGITMRMGIERALSDASTEVVVLVSKPAEESVRNELLAFAEQRCVARGARVIAVFVGDDIVGDDVVRDDVAAVGAKPHGTVVLASTLATAARHAVASVTNCPFDSSEQWRVSMTGMNIGFDSNRRFVHGAFCGGTFQSEANWLFARAGHRAVKELVGNGHGDPVLDAHTMIDFGDDRYTVGRAHPMIDSSIRDSRIRAALRSPTTAVVLFDVVLGYATSSAPIAGLANLLRELGPLARLSSNPGPILIANVCGTDDDPTPRSTVVTELRDLGVNVADSNADAVNEALAILASLPELATHR